MAISIAAGEYLDGDTGTFVSRRGRRETLEFQGLWSGQGASLVLYRSPLSQIGLSLILIVLTAVAIVVSVCFPMTVLRVPLLFHGIPMRLIVPLIGIVPFVLFLMLARRLLNHRYVLTADSVSEVKGLVGLRLVWSQLDYKDIREVVVYQDSVQQMMNLGDIQIGSDVNEEEIVLRGIHNPLRLKLIIRERMNAKRGVTKENPRKVAQSW